MPIPSFPTNLQARPTPPDAGVTPPDAVVYVAAWDGYARAAASGARRSVAWRTLRETLTIVVVAAAIFFGSRTVVQGREVLGPSMQPTYHTGQRLFVLRYFFHDPNQGDIVVFHPPVPSKDDYIKRVVGGPGDHIAVKDGRVAVNGLLLNEPYLNGVRTPCAGRWCDLTLGPDEYFVMGDNRPASSDSRAWGPVTKDQIVGRAWLLYYPFSDFGFVP